MIGSPFGPPNIGSLLGPPNSSLFGPPIASIALNNWKCDQTNNTNFIHINIGQPLLSRFLLASKYIHHLKCMSDAEQFNDLQKLISSQVWNRYNLTDGGQNYSRTHIATNRQAYIIGSSLDTCVWMHVDIKARLVLFSTSVGAMWSNFDARKL